MSYYNYDRNATTLTTSEKITGRGAQLLPMMFGGRVVTNTGVDRISQSLYCIFSTRRGERVFNPEFGTRIYELLHEPNDDVLKDLLVRYATEDIQKWEPRIEASVGCVLVPGSSVVTLNIVYKIIGDFNTYSYVYPINRDIREIGGV